MLQKIHDKADAWLDRKINAPLDALAERSTKKTIEGDPELDIFNKPQLHEEERNRLLRWISTVLGVSCVGVESSTAFYSTLVLQYTGESRARKEKREHRLNTVEWIVRLRVAIIGEGLAFIFTPGNLISRFAIWVGAGVGIKESIRQQNELIPVEGESFESQPDPTRFWKWLVLGIVAPAIEHWVTHGNRTLLGEQLEALGMSEGGAETINQVLRYILSLAGASLLYLYRDGPPPGSVVTEDELELLEGAQPSEG